MNASTQNEAEAAAGEGLPPTDQTTVAERGTSGARNPEPADEVVASVARLRTVLAPLLSDAELLDRGIGEMAPSLLEASVAQPEPVDLAEVSSLITYASERGLDSEGHLVVPLSNAVGDYRALKTVLKTVDIKSLSARDAARAKVAWEGCRAEILRLYAQLSKLTAPVNGRTLRETDTEFRGFVRPLHLFAALFLVVVIGNEILRVWLNDIVEPEEGWLLQVINFRRYFLDVCTPFLWGGLGACVWLLKRLNDFAEQQSFDSTVSHGWATRIFLGAVLGGAVQFIYDRNLFTTQELNLDASALGFLTGVGVKVVYGAIEKTIETLATKLNLETVRASKGDSAAIRVYLNEQIGRSDKVKEPEKRKLLLEMLDDLKETKKAD